MRLRNMRKRCSSLIRGSDRRAVKDEQVVVKARVVRAVKALRVLSGVVRVAEARSSFVLDLV